MQKSSSRVSSIRLKKRYEDNKKHIHAASSLDNCETNKKLKAWKLEFEKNKMDNRNRDPLVFNEELFIGISDNKFTKNTKITQKEKTNTSCEENFGIIFIEDLELSKKLAEWFLWQDDLLYIYDLEELTAKELMGRKGFGKKFLCEIKDALSKLGMRLNERKE